MDEKIILQISEDLNISKKQVIAVLKLLEEENTIPFIARYRKEATGGLDEVQINEIQKVYQYQMDLKKRKEQEAESHLVNSLVDAVCKASYAKFPKSLIDSEVENQVKRVEEQAKQYKMPVEVLLQYSGMASLDDFKKNAEDYARKSFLQELVIDKIIELEKIEASDKEIEAEYKKIAGVKDQDKDADKKIAQVKKQYRINQVAYQVKANKVIELLKANAITKTQKSE